MTTTNESTIDRLNALFDLESATIGDYRVDRLASRKFMVYRIASPSLSKTPLGSANSAGEAVAMIKNDMH